MIARMEAKIVLEVLLETVAAFRLAGPTVRRLNNTLFALASLPVEIEPA
jgi:4-methoxybenzoate monooxygenase (O-demethylating)